MKESVIDTIKVIGIISIFLLIGIGVQAFVQLASGNVPFNFEEYRAINWIAQLLYFVSIICLAILIHIDK